MQGWIDLHERLEDALDHARRNSFSRVANTNDGMVVFQSGGDPDSAARVGVLGGIVQEVGQNLFEPGGIPFQAHDLAGIHFALENTLGCASYARSRHMRFQAPRRSVSR